MLKRLRHDLKGQHPMNPLRPSTNSLMDCVYPLIWVLWGWGMAIWMVHAVVGRWVLDRRTSQGMHHAPT